MEIQHFSHPDHTLKLVDSIEESEVPDCDGCNEVMCFPGYATSDDESDEELFCHPRHRHKLTLQQQEPKEDESDDGSSGEEIKYCFGCNEVMCFPGYACHECEFYLHKSCAELPPKILHPLHPHPLTCSTLTDEVLICDGCRDLYDSGFNFNCSWSCGFNLDAKCASKQDQEYHHTFKELTLFRLYHEHALKLCNVTRLDGGPIRCCCCRQIISTGSSAYCCIECEFFIHESCTEIPMEIHHPFHPQHLLLAQDVAWNAYRRLYRSCDACKWSIDGIKIGCNECNFQLHVSCANPNRGASPLKHNCHEHNMYYFVKDDTTGSFECNKCHEGCAEESFYRCVMCDFNLHLKCIPIPSVVMITQKHHHPLTLIDSVKEDNPLFQYLMDLNDNVDYSMDYYCDICETPGNPKRHAYCCKECIYIAHVECIISEDNTPQENPSNLNLKHGPEPKKEQKMSDEEDFHPAESDRSTEQAAQSMSKKNGATSDDESDEELFCHRYKLTLLQQEPKEDESDDGSSGEEIKYCFGCNEVMCFPGYACNLLVSSFYLHKSCAELPPKILHPLHPHPLTRSTLTHEFKFGEALICDRCRDLYRSGFNFRCSWSCGFNLDAKCASKQDQEYHHTFKQLTLFRFYHKHALKLCNVTRLDGESIDCCCCRQIISTGSSAYCCTECEFFIHESCTEIPLEVHHPFHSQHILVAQAMDQQDDYRCAACKESIDGIKIGCNECNFHLHVSCANPNICACPLKHPCHEHNMYYFVEDDTTESWSFECNKCHEECLDEEAFYRCVECDFNLHLKCIPIPSVVTVTQKHHHPLTLIDSVKEDNSLIQYLMDSNDKVDYFMDYYCDVCETPGNPKRHAYYCKECIYIAHVECIISKECPPLEILQYLVPRRRHEAEQHNNMRRLTNQRKRVMKRLIEEEQ